MGGNYSWERLKERGKSRVHRTGGDKPRVHRTRRNVATGNGCRGIGAGGGNTTRYRSRRGGDRNVLIIVAGSIQRMGQPMEVFRMVANASATIPRTSLRDGDQNKNQRGEG